MTATMGFRVFFDLKLFGKRQKAVAHDGVLLVNGFHGCHPRTLSQNYAPSYVLDITAPTYVLYICAELQAQVKHPDEIMGRTHAWRNTIR